MVGYNFLVVSRTGEFATVTEFVSPETLTLSFVGSWKLEE
jgi:hypothetical protein